MITRLRKAYRLQLLPLVLGFALLVGIIGARSFLIESQRDENARDSRRVRAPAIHPDRAEQDAGRRDQPARLSAHRGGSPISNPTAAALNRIPELMAGLHAAAERNDLRRDRVLALDAAIKDKLAELADVLGLYEADKMTDALSIVRGDRGKLAMDKVRATITILLDEEDAQLADKLAQCGSDRAAPEPGVHPGAVRRLCRSAAYGAFTARRMLRDVSAAQRQAEPDQQRPAPGDRHARGGGGAGAPDAEDGGGRPADRRHRA